ncbi:MAG: hypothetical protein DRP08_01535 [Candidatus Aenigmatarchaeota archaeon]|nr:MAG: hypothetical protein DRP08_01535 [Candidatus Aenigmarchaeota archaeon]
MGVVKAPKLVPPLDKLMIFRASAQMFTSDLMNIIDKLHEIAEQLMLLDYFIPVIKCEYTVEENSPWGE